MGAFYRIKLFAESLKEKENEHQREAIEKLR